MTQTELLTTPEAAQALRLSERTLIRWRVDRKGPPVVRAGRRIMYRASDLDAWLERHTHAMPRDRKPQSANARAQAVQP